MEKNKGITIPIWLLVILAMLAGMGIYAVMGRMPEKAGDDSAGKEGLSLLTDLLSGKPEEGWYEEDGLRYCYSQGEPLKGWWDVDNVTYYFDENGVMARDTKKTVEGNTYTFDSQGQVTEVCYGVLYGTWSEDAYRHGNGGTASCMEFGDLVENCTSLEFAVEAQGNHGATVEGNWDLVLKIDGAWQKPRRFSVQGNTGSLQVNFDSPTTVEAAAAYPKIQGNASYSCMYELRNVVVKAG